MYWNRLPRLIRLERLLKSAALCLLVVAFVVLYRAYPKAGNPKPGFYVMLGFLFVGIAAWQTIGKLTRRGSRLSDALSPRPIVVVRIGVRDSTTWPPRSRSR